MRIQKHVLFTILCTTFLLTFSGCGQDTGENSPCPEQDSPAKSIAAEQEKTEDLVQLYQEIYEEAIQAQSSDAYDWKNLAVVQEITRKLGEHGVTAVDSENQVNMENPDKMHDFITALAHGETARLTILLVSAYDRFTKYDLLAKEGALAVVKTYYQYEDGIFQNKNSASYPADSWQYTDEGYFIFTGRSFSAQSLVLTMSDEEEYAAWRVAPLDEQCREWNRRYVLPAGYGRNNMFLTDWSETDYGNLDFYDIFDKYYPAVNGQPAPYTPSDNAAVGAVYQIPESEFEEVVSLHLAIDSTTLRAKTKYLEADRAYEYRPRGFYETEYPNLPYPEVTDGTENEDGTLTLLVNAVYPNAETSRAFTHELVIRPDAQGGFQYVSNNVLEKNCDMGWHTDRLTEEAWENAYGETSLLTEEERAGLEAAAQASSAFADASPTEKSGSLHYSTQQCQEVVSLLGKAGLISVGRDIPMENPEQLEAFYNDYQENRDAEAAVFSVNTDGTIDTLTFLHKNGKLQVCYIGIGWRSDGTPQKTDERLRNVADLKLTPKGYLIYSWQDPDPYADLCQYWRIRPLPDQYRKLTEKYVHYLSYVNYDILVTNWAESNAESILTPCMYEDLCRIHTGKEPDVKNGRIPAAQYEEIMTRYLPVTKEQVQKICDYDEETDSYPYEMILHRQYPPFGEVVGYTENPDGTITLTVNGVWVEKFTDCAFTNTIVVQPFEDGSFRYLSNAIEQKESEIPSL